MKRIALAAAALTMIAAPAFAQSNTASSSVTLNANVGKQCGVGNPLSGASQSFATTDTVVLADANGQFAGKNNIQLGFGNFWCNAPATVTLKASPLKTAGIVNDASSFTNVFDLSITTGAAIYWGGSAADVYQTNGIDATLSPAFTSTAGAFESGTGQYSRLVVNVLKNASNKRPIAGAYVGSVTLTVTAS